MTVSDITAQIEAVCNFLENFRKTSAKARKMLALNVMKSPGKALETRAEIGKAALSKNPRASTFLYVVIFFHEGKRL